MALLLGIAIQSEAQADCSCGPDFCIDEAKYVDQLKRKRAALQKQGYPEDLLQLLDKTDHCVAAIARAPDAFSLMSVGPNGDTLVTEWSEDTEEAVAAGLEEGTYGSYYKFNVRKLLACCEKPMPEKRADWNAQLQLSSSQAILCKMNKGTVACR